MPIGCERLQQMCRYEERRWQALAQAPVSAECREDRLRAAREWAEAAELARQMAVALSLQVSGPMRSECAGENLTAPRIR